MKNQNTSRFISSLIYIAMGLVLIIYPTVIGDTICYMLSGAAVVVGVLQIIGYAMTTVEPRVLENNNGLASSVIIMIFGVVMMLNPFSTAKVLSIMIGVGLLVSGAADMAANVMMTRMLKKMKED